MPEWVQQVLPKTKIDDLVFSKYEKQLLKKIVEQFRALKKPGFDLDHDRKKGVKTLFSGTNQIGKTLAAEVLANELQLELFRIDLSALISKYNGETEKNLRSIFEAADKGGDILFFDEADALFGKRTEVSNSHNRYRNIDVNILLEKMEEFRVLCILATDKEKCIDAASMRRFNFIVNFPFHKDPPK